MTVQRQRHNAECVFWIKYVVFSRNLITWLYEDLTLRVHAVSRKSKGAMDEQINGIKPFDHKFINWFVFDSDWEC